jgi:hypothetical protein
LRGAVARQHSAVSEQARNTVAALDDVATQLAAHADAIRALAKSAQRNIIEIGRRLTKARDDVGHGNWLQWLTREFSWSDRTALNFMRVYELSRLSEKFSDLSIPMSALYLLARPSTPDEVREQVIERAEAGERITVAAVKEAVEQAATDLPAPPVENDPPAPRPRKPPPEKPAIEVWGNLAESIAHRLEWFVDLQVRVLAENNNATGKLAKIVKDIGKLDIKSAHKTAHAALKLGKKLADLSNKQKRLADPAIKWDCHGDEAPKAEVARPASEGVR